jgi:hypothetical protein
MPKGWKLRQLLLQHIPVGPLCCGWLVQGPQRPMQLLQEQLLLVHHLQQLLLQKAWPRPSP